MRAFSCIGKQTLITVRVLLIRNVGTLDRSGFGCTRKHALRTIWNEVTYGRAHYRFQQDFCHSADLASSGCEHVIDHIIRLRRFRLCVEQRTIRKLDDAHQRQVKLSVTSNCILTIKAAFKCPLIRAAFCEC